MHGKKIFFLIFFLRCRTFFFFFLGNCLSILIFIYLFGVLRRFQHCTGHITMGSWKGRGNQYLQFVRVMYCNLLTNGKQVPAFPLEAVCGSNPGLSGGGRVLPTTLPPWPLSNSYNKMKCYLRLRGLGLIPNGV